MDEAEELLSSSKKSPAAAVSPAALLATIEKVGNLQQYVDATDVEQNLQLLKTAL